MCRYQEDRPALCETGIQVPVGGHRRHLVRGEVPGPESVCSAAPVRASLGSDAGERVYALPRVKIVSLAQTPQTPRARLRLLATAIFYSLGSVAVAQGPGGDFEPGGGAKLPRAEDLVAKALERSTSEERSRLELAFVCMVDSAVETLDAEGQVTFTETKRSRRIPLEGYLYDELVERDGKTLSPEQSSRESRKKARFVREARKRAARGERLESDRRRMRFNEHLMSRYRTAVEGSEEILGHDCWVVRFEPREGDLPSGGAMDRALNQSSGRLWIKKSDFALARVMFAMDAPVRYLWGLFATLRKADGQIDYAPVEAGVWLPNRFELELDLRLLKGVKSIRRRIRNEWTDYRRVAATASPQLSP